MGLSGCERQGCSQVLMLLNSEDLFSLAKTVTKPTVKVCTRKEAIDAILQHSQSATELLNRRKVYRDTISHYLSNEGVYVQAKSKKIELIQAAIAHWRATDHSGLRFLSTFQHHVSYTVPSSQSTARPSKGGSGDDSSIFGVHLPAKQKPISSTASTHHVSYAVPSSQSAARPSKGVSDDDSSIFGVHLPAKQKPISSTAYTHHVSNTVPSSQSAARPSRGVSDDDSSIFGVHLPAKQKPISSTASKHHVSYTVPSSQSTARPSKGGSGDESSILGVHLPAEQKPVLSTASKHHVSYTVPSSQSTARPSRGVLGDDSSILGVHLPAEQKPISSTASKHHVSYAVPSSQSTRPSKGVSGDESSILGVHLPAEQKPVLSTASKDNFSSLNKTGSTQQHHPPLTPQSKVSDVEFSKLLSDKISQLSINCPHRDDSRAQTVTSPMLGPQMTEEIKTSVWPGDCEMFGKEFCEWFYSLLNSQNPSLGQEKGDCGPQHFSSNAVLYLEHRPTETKREYHGAEYRPTETKREYHGAQSASSHLVALTQSERLYFHPSNEVKCVNSEQGFVEVTATGLVLRDGAYLGTFGQRFILTANTHDKLFKISLSILVIYA